MPSHALETVAPVNLLVTKKFVYVPLCVQLTTTEPLALPVVTTLTVVVEGVVVVVVVIVVGLVVVLVVVVLVVEGVEGVVVVVFNVVKVRELVEPLLK